MCVCVHVSVHVDVGACCVCMCFECCFYYTASTVPRETVSTNLKRYVGTLGGCKQPHEMSSMHRHVTECFGCIFPSKGTACPASFPHRNVHFGGMCGECLYDVVSVGVVQLMKR